LTAPIDITDSRLVKAIAHPLRLQILTLLNNRVASPSEIAIELGTPLSNTSYHVRQLATLGFIDLVDRAARRGAIEHYYTATVRPTITDDAWSNMPEIVKRALVASGLEQGVAHIASAARAGGFDREDVHYSRTAGRLDSEAWAAVSAELAGVLARVDRIVEQSEARLSKDPDAESDDATVMMMLFSGPPSGTLPARRRAPRRRRRRPANA
jgi:DNA-binding transcriptional ArsR family regulator